MRKLLHAALIVVGVTLAGCSGMGSSTQGTSMTPGGTNYLNSPTGAIPLSG